MKKPLFFCLGIIVIHHEMPKVGVVNRLCMRIVHNLVKFRPLLIALYPPLQSLAILRIDIWLWLWFITCWTDGLNPSPSRRPWPLMLSLEQWIVQRDQAVGEYSQCMDTWPISAKVNYYYYYMQSRVYRVAIRQLDTGNFCVMSFCMTKFRVEKFSRNDPMPRAHNAHAFS